MVDTLNDQLRKGGSIPTPTLQDCSVIAYPLFYTENNISPTSPLQFEIIEIPIKRAVQLNRKWHSRLPKYETGMILKSKICFGAIYKGKYYSVAIWDNPSARMLPQYTWLELKRMAICSEAPKNTASRMISIMVKIIKHKLPDIKKLISYQDVETHCGTIYKASGWKIGRYSNGGGWGNRTNSFNTITRTPRRRPDLNNATGPKIRWEKDL